MIDPALGFHIDPKSAGIPGKSEQWVQTQFNPMLHMNFPGYEFASIPNEGKQHPGQGLLSNAAGRTSGFPDGVITGPDAWVAFIETKRWDNPGLSMEQKKQMRRLHELGFRVAMVRSAESLRMLMRGWGC